MIIFEKDIERLIGKRSEFADYGFEGGLALHGKRSGGSPAPPPAPAQPDPVLTAQARPKPKAHKIGRRQSRKRK